jgi:uncharacterized protein YkwD
LIIRMSHRGEGLARGKVILGTVTLAVLLVAGFHLRSSFSQERMSEVATLVAEHLQTARAEARVEVYLAEDGSVYLVQDEVPEVEKPEIITQAPETAPQGDELNEALAEEVLRLTNEKRVENGLSPLARHEALEHAAVEHSQEMREMNYFSHTSPTAGKATTRQRVNQYGVNPQLVAENIFECSGYDLRLTSKFAVEAFMQSPGHRHNLLNPATTHIGVGFAAKEGSVSVTQVFGAGL